LHFSFEVTLPQTPDQAKINVSENNWWQNYVGSTIDIACCLLKNIVDELKDSVQLTS